MTEKQENEKRKAVEEEEINGATEKVTTDAIGGKEEAKTATRTTSGSAFGGFSACSGKDAFVELTTPASSNGLGAEALSSADSSSRAAGMETSSDLNDATSSSLLLETTMSSSSSGFASFQSSSSATFASFAATQSMTEGFGAKASSSLSTTFSHTDVVKKADPAVPALSEAEVNRCAWRLFMHSLIVLMTLLLLMMTNLVS